MDPPLLAKWDGYTSVFNIDITLHDWLIDLCLTPTLAMFQLHRGIITLQDYNYKEKVDHNRVWLEKGSKAHPPLVALE